eukprot:TRINITY_DN5522_c2_g2_i1.p1 TRINITY_DN5522_c2_g2~~TRINITY_DN5522_c2_g2_i1.p1  ORF type:complete len:729 (+),score=116.07 TRINITY_DN5522_c2_g2_i1:50-2188(+)
MGAASSRLTAWSGGYTPVNDTENPIEMEMEGYSGLASEKRFGDQENLNTASEGVKLFAPGGKKGDTLRRDQGLVRIYKYWKLRGFNCILVDKMLHIIRCVFTIGFTVILFVYVNWDELMRCGGEEGCRNVDLFKPDPYDNLSLTLKVLLFFEISFFIVVIITVMKFVFLDYWALCDVRKFYTDELHIVDDDIYFGVYDWSTIASKLKKWQFNLDNRIATHYNQGGKKEDTPILNELNMAQCIMRSENYLISFVNTGVFKLNSLNTTTVQIVKELMIGYFFEINSENALSTRKKDAETTATTVFRLKIYLILGAIFLILGSPFVLAWRVAYKSFRYGLMFKSEPGKLVMRTWSLEALWKFREFNELDHVFDMRMYNSRRVAQEYIEKYPNGVERIAAVTFTFMLTGLLGFMIVLSLLNDAALLHVTVHGRSLLWWLSILSAVVGSVTQLLKDDELRAGLIFDPIAGFKAISNCTHWRPKGWNNPAEHVTIYKDFKSFYFPWAAWVFFQEGASVVTTPLQLLFIILPKAEQIVEHMNTCTVRVCGVGDVVAFSTCDFYLYGSYRYGMQGENRKIAEICKEGKMEKSYLSFIAMQGPAFKSSKEGDALIDEIKRRTGKTRTQEEPIPLPDAALGTIYGVSDSNAMTSVVYKPSTVGVAEHAAAHIQGESDVTQMQRLTRNYNAIEDSTMVRRDAQYAQADYGYKPPSKKGYSSLD